MFYWTITAASLSACVWEGVGVKGWRVCGVGMGWGVCVLFRLLNSVRCFCFFPVAVMY